MEQTTNYNLNKPGLSDSVSIQQLNSNSDILDENLYRLDQRVDLTNGGTINGNLSLTGKVSPHNGIEAVVTNGILADAVACTGYNSTYFFVGNGSDYTDNDLPNSNYAYGSFIVTRRYSTKIQVTAIPEDTTIYPIATNTWSSGSWYGWRFEGANKPVTTTSSATVTRGTWTAVCSASLDPGIYIIDGSLHFPSNESGNRELEIYNTGYAANKNRVNKSAVTGDYTIISHSLTVAVESTKTISLRAYHTAGTSGTTLSVTGYLTYTRIR